MWSLGCIIYELIRGDPLFPAKDENELLEYWIVTVGRPPAEMLKTAKKYKQFFSPASLINGLFGDDYGHTVKRVKNSRFGKGDLQPAN